MIAAALPVGAAHAFHRGPPLRGQLVLTLGQQRADSACLRCVARSLFLPAFETAWSAPRCLSLQPSGKPGRASSLPPR